MTNTTGMSLVERLRARAYWQIQPTDRYLLEEAAAEIERLSALSPPPPGRADLPRLDLIVAFLRERDEAIGPYDEDDAERLDSARYFLSLIEKGGAR